MQIDITTADDFFVVIEGTVGPGVGGDTAIDSLLVFKGSGVDYISKKSPNTYYYSIFIIRRNLY